MRGSWLVKKESIRGMSRAQLKDNLALESEPDQIGEVKVPRGIESFSQPAPLPTVEIGPLPDALPDIIDPPLDPIDPEIPLIP